MMRSQTVVFPLAVPPQTPIRNGSLVPIGGFGDNGSNNVGASPANSVSKHFSAAKTGGRWR